MSLADAVRPDWLSAALSERSPGVRVTSVEISNVHHGVATHISLNVQYEQFHDGGLPGSLFLKGGFEGEDNAHLLVGGAFYREARFYRDLAPQLPVQTPLCYYAGFDPETKQGVLVLEDIESNSGEFRKLGGSVSVDEALGFLQELAALHAATWNVFAKRDFAWLPELPALAAGLFNPAAVDMMSNHFAGPRGAVVPAGLADPQRILSGLQRLFEWRPDSSGCVLHGDLHGGNVYLTAAGRPGMYDWQTVQRGPWAQDVAYYLAGCLDVTDRRTHGRDLLAHYLRVLAAHGVPAPTFDDAWLSYRQRLGYGLFVWSMVRELIIDIDVCMTMLDRYASAAADDDTFGALNV